MGNNGFDAHLIYVFVQGIIFSQGPIDAHEQQQTTPVIYDIGANNDERPNEVRFSDNGRSVYHPRNVLQGHWFVL